MKSQSLPISTIIIIVLSIVVLSAVLLFFFSGFGKPSNTLSEQEALSRCQSRCSIIASNSPNSSEISNVIGDYCTQKNVAGEQKKCDQLMNCYVASADCVINCSATKYGCS